VIFGVSRGDGQRNSGSRGSPLHRLLATGVLLLGRPTIAELGFAALGVARSCSFVVEDLPASAVVSPELLVRFAEVSDGRRDQGRVHRSRWCSRCARRWSWRAWARSPRSPAGPLMFQLSCWFSSTALPLSVPVASDVGNQQS
jgi:hypothetical protein